MITPLILKPLPYPPSALEPALSERAVRAHYELNHAGYVNKANEMIAASKGRMGPRTMESFAFNQSGARLHELFWESFVPGGELPSPWLAGVLDYGEVVSDLLEAAMSVMGSGWAMFSERAGQMAVHVIENHDYQWEVMNPLIAVDVWEHSFYLDHLDNRRNYLVGLLPLIDWRRVEARAR